MPRDSTTAWVSFQESLKDRKKTTSTDCDRSDRSITSTDEAFSDLFGAQDTAGLVVTRGRAGAGGV